MQSSTNNDNIYIYIYCFLRAQLLQKNLFSQSKNYFFYINIAFEMSHTIVFLVFGILNTKYLAFRTPDATTLILGWLEFFIFYFKVLFLLSFWVE